MKVTSKKQLSDVQFQVLFTAQARINQLNAALQQEQTRMEEVTLLLSDALNVNLSEGRVELNPSTKELLITVEQPDSVDSSPSA